MHDPYRMRLCQSIGNLGQPLEQRQQWRVLTMNLVSESDTVDELHCDESETITFSNLVDVGNMRMIQCGSGLGFSSKTFHSIAIHRNFLRENLHGDRTIELEIFRQ